MRAFAMTGIVTASWMPSIMLGSDMRATPPSLRMSDGTRSSAMTAAAPASSAIRACSGVTTSMITPPFSISARPDLTLKVPVSISVLRIELPGARPAHLEQPRVEEAFELAPAVALGRRYELLRRDIRVLVLGVPVAHDPEEDRVADPLAERLQGHRAAVVHRPPEQVRRPGQRVRRREPELLATRRVLAARRV